MRSEPQDQPKAGDPPASGPSVEDMYAALRPGLVRFAIFLLGDASLAEDICQEAFMATLRRLPAINSPEAYLRTTVLNLVRRRHRGVERLRGTLVRAAGQRLTETPSPCDEVIAHNGLLAALSRLNRNQRDVVVLVYHLDMPIHLAAEQLGMPVGTAKSHLSRALARLRREASTWT